MSVKFTNLGAMCILIERSDGFKILLDPYLKKNKATPKEPSDFYDVDLILVTHHAGDHYGDVVDILDHGHAHLIAPSDVVYYVKKECTVPVEERKNDPINGRLNASAYGDTREYGITKIHTVQAIHLSKGTVNGVPVYGQPSGFVLEVEPGVTYYHTGDTALYGDMKMIREMYHPNIMCVGLGAIKPFASREMDARHAATACAWVGADYIIPTHYMENGTELSDFTEHIEYIYPRAQLLPKLNTQFQLIPSRIEWDE